MTSDDDPDKWLKNGPAAWFTIAAVVAIMVGAVAWSYGEFRADRAVREALALAADNATRESLRNELDLAAQQTMATAAIVAAILSAVSMAFVALTVWFTRDASVQSRRALTETLRISQRELRPYLAAAFSNYRSDRHGHVYSLIFTITNYGSTPAYLRHVSFYLSNIEHIFSYDLSGTIPIGEILGPDKSIETPFIKIGKQEINKISYHEEQITVIVKILFSDIFKNNQNITA